MARYRYRRYWGHRRGYYRKRRKSTLNSVMKTGSRVTRFGVNTTGRVVTGAAKWGSKAASHVIVAGASTISKIFRNIFRG